MILNYMLQSSDFIYFFDSYSIMYLGGEINNDYKNKIKL